MLADFNFKPLSGGKIAPNSATGEAQVKRLQTAMNRLGQGSTSVTGSVDAGTALLLQKIVSNTDKRFTELRGILVGRALTLTPTLTFIATHADDYATAFEQFQPKLATSSTVATVGKVAGELVWNAMQGRTAAAPTYVTAGGSTPWGYILGGLALGYLLLRRR